MRYSASEKAEMIHLVENSSLSMRQTLRQLDIHQEHNAFNKECAQRISLICLLCVGLIPRLLCHNECCFFFVPF